MQINIIWLAYKDTEWVWGVQRPASLHQTYQGHPATTKKQILSRRLPFVFLGERDSEAMNGGMASGPPPPKITNVDLKRAIDFEEMSSPNFQPLILRGELLVFGGSSVSM